VQNAGDNSQRYTYHDDGSLTAGGYAPTKWTSQFRGSSDAKKITGFRLEMLTDPELPLNGPGRSPVGLFALSEFVVEVAGKPVKLVSATTDFGNERMPLDTRYDDRSGKQRFTGPVSYAIDGDHLTVMHERASAAAVANVIDHRLAMRRKDWPGVRPHTGFERPLILTTMRWFAEVSGESSKMSSTSASSAKRMMATRRFAWLRSCGLRSSSWTVRFRARMAWRPLAASSRSRRRRPC